MSENRDNGGPAFPFVDSASPHEHQGMSLRDYFAAKAMQALLSSQAPYGEDMPKPYSENSLNVDELAAYAYAQADAMLEARK